MTRSQHSNWEELTLQFTRYLQNDGAAAETCFREFLRILRSYFRMRMPRDADFEDLVQTVLLKIHFARDRYDSKLSLKTWVFTLASRSLIDHWRGKASGKKVFATKPADDDSGDLSAAQASLELDPAWKVELTEDINQALMHLKPIDRSIVYLFGVEEFSMAEIANTLQLSEGAVKVRAHRAYRELRKLLVALSWIGITAWMQ